MHARSYSSYIIPRILIPCILTGLLFTGSIEPLTSKEKQRWMGIAVVSVVINAIVWQVMKASPSAGCQVPRIVEDFVQEQLAAINLENRQSVKVRAHKDIFFAASHNTIYIRQDLVDKIESLLMVAENDPKADKALNKYRAVIQHEGGHIKHAHVYKGFVAGTTAPLGFIGAFLYAKEKLSPHSISRSILDFISEFALETREGMWFLQIPSTLCLLAYSRYNEWQADGCMVNDEDILQGGIDMFQELLEEKDDVEGWIAYLSTHPTLKDRIAHLKERIRDVKRSKKRYCAS